MNRRIISRIIPRPVPISARRLQSTLSSTSTTPVVSTKQDTAITPTGEGEHGIVQAEVVSGAPCTFFLNIISFMVWGLTSDGTFQQRNCFIAWFGYTNLQEILCNLVEPKVKDGASTLTLYHLADDGRIL